MLKDYYAILDIPVTASLPEIKRAYRKLAMMWHPDKQHNNAYATTKFNEIKEAYEVLINPGKREDYLNSRWLYHAHNWKMEAEAATPVSILKRSVELHQITAGYDPSRMNHERLANNILSLISDANIEALKQFHEPGAEENIIRILLDCTKKLQLPFAEKVADQLHKLSANSNLTAEINQHISNRRKKELLKKYQPVAIVLLIVILCFIIYSSSK